MIPYGYNLIGRIFYDPDHKDVDYACKKLPFVGEDHKVDESPIIMVHRGNCTFVKKTHNVEIAGGHVALIIDNIDEDPQRIVMADDGKGKEISIPGVLISKKNGEIITDFIAQNKDREQEIVLEIDFEMEHPSNTVQYAFFTNADDESVYKLISDFYYYQKEIIDSVKFDVHYITYQHPEYNSDPKGVNIPRPNCLGNGRYCAFPGKFGTTDGREIVKEGLKQRCIFAYEKEHGKETLYYWSYISEFYSQCLNNTMPKYNQECSAMVMQKIGVPQDKINECIYNSYIDKNERRQNDYELIVKNSILESDNLRRFDYMMTFIPSIIVNNRTFHGNWRSENLFEALCAGYKKKPEVCYDEGAFSNSSKGLSWLSITMILILIVSVNVVIFYFCRNYIRKKIRERIESTDINHKINTVVTSYLALRENK